MDQPKTLATIPSSTKERLLWPDHESQERDTILESVQMTTEGTTFATTAGAIGLRMALSQRIAAEAD